MGINSPQRLVRAVNRAVTLALTLTSPAARGDSPTYTYGKSRPMWARRDLSSSLIGWYTSLNVYSVRTAHSKKVHISIHSCIDLCMYVARHMGGTSAER